MDLVMVLDSSGSMRSSDQDRTSIDAVRMLVNMMPAGDSRVGVISFNTNPTVLTKAGDGSNTLVSLNDYSGVETIRQSISEIKFLKSISKSFLRSP